MTIVMRFSNRARYGRALRHLWQHPERYQILLRGADYSKDAILRDKARECGWYVEFKIIGGRAKHGQSEEGQ